MAATMLLQKRQLQLLCRILRSLEGHPLRTANFIPGTNWPIAERYIRRQGRPRKEWVRNMLSVAHCIFDGMGSLQHCAADKAAWEQQLVQVMQHGLYYSVACNPRAARTAFDTFFFCL